MIVLIDTNVILDIFLRREPFFETSYQALHRMIERDADCYVSAAAVTDIFYILRKSLQSKELAKKYIGDLKQLVHFADIQEKDIDAALTADLSDFEDAVVDAVAARLGADCILTRNIRDFSGSHVHAITPTVFLQK